ncbi:hypothetical protein ALI144C_06090 [Actinosynnema sp. ALI-1.44]|uniref:glycohydrolase toxin TNT-related protein n=1 Tax=Actinosynnema sp. ALI-1.44 TaxID=1933779 RepID=UPI00097C3DF5|nr:glycohydrolase toxin TNT-related protein [Actinosynnema sp. ALI-1.44]ONI88603.1 hypothetical protein ALI144C_06090 [Actinosynnema sp. ALI-1.44]
MRIGVSGGAVFGVEDGPDRTGYVSQDTPVDGQLVTLPDGRAVKQVSLTELESVFTLHTVDGDGLDVADADPLAGYLAPPDSVVRQVREVARDERVAVWFPALPTEAAPEGDPNTASGALLASLGAAVAAAAPDGWSGVSIDCEALVSRMVVTVMVTMADGTVRHWSPPPVVSQWLHRLRMRDYHPGRGVWFRARFELTPNAPVVRDVDALSPLSFMTDAEDCADELRLLPRNADAVPRWLLDAAVRSQQAGRSAYAEEPLAPGRPETVPLFDGRDDTGLPTWYRPVLSQLERQAVLEYMRSARLVLSARGQTRDELAGVEDAVPMGFHTDGRFVWSSAAWYYLDKHGVPPALALVEHIRSVRHQLPKSVPGIALDRASALAMGRPWNESEVDNKANQALGPVEAAILTHRISPRFYSVFAERDDAWCLVRDGDQYRVQWSHDERTAVLFDDVRQAAVYLAGQLAANGPSLEYELGEEIPAWQSPLVVLSDDPPVESFAAVSTVMIQNVEVDRYGSQEGNLVYVAETPFEQRGLPPEYANRPYHRYRISGDPWRVVSVVAAEGGRGYVLPKPIEEYLRQGYLEEVVAQAGHPGLPPINDDMRAAAAQNPNGWVYCADPDVDPRFIEGIPLPVVLGGYKVGPDGQFTGETFVNEDYRPSPRLRGYPEPQTDFELVLGYVAAGWLPHHEIVPVSLEAPFLLETDGNGGLRIGVDGNGREFLAVYSSPGYVPPDAQAVMQTSGRELAPALSGLTVIVNPGGAFGIELPGEDIMQAAGVPQQA